MSRTRIASGAPAWLASAVHALALIGLFVLLWDFYFDAFYENVASLFVERFGRAPYFAASVYGACSKHPLLLLSFAAPLLFLGCHWKALAWRRFRLGRSLRWFNFALVALLAWTYSTHDYNFYVDQAHTIDRLILVASALLVLVHPLFLAAFLPLCLVMMSQFDHPFGVLSLTDKFVPYVLIVLFLALNIWVALLRSVHLALSRLSTSLRGRGVRVPDLATPLEEASRRQREGTHYLFVALCLCGASYFAPGLKKLAISPHLADWVVQNELHVHALWKVHGGWLGFLDVATRRQVVDLVRTAEIPFLALATVIELSGLLLLYRHRWSVVFLLGFVLLHAGIFSTSGILFWKWMVADLGLVALLLALERSQRTLLFTNAHFLLSIPLIAFSFLYLDAPRLGWWDTRYSYRFEFEVVGESGAVYHLSNDFMDPYHMFFSFNRLYFLLDENALRPRTAQTKEVRDAIRIAGPDGLPSLRERHGRHYFDEAGAKQLDDFLATFFENMNGGFPKKVFLSRFGAPHHLQTLAPEDLRLEPYSRQEPVSEVRIRLKRHYYDGTSIRLLENEVIRTVEIPEGSSVPATDGT